MLPTLVLLAQESAYEVIISETANSRGMETGGILVGQQLTYQGQPVIVVVGASGPGRDAERSAISFAPDLDFQLTELDALRRHYAQYGMDFVGEWHKHPYGLPCPTSGDVRQAHAILNDPDYVLPHGGILIPITQLGEEGGDLRVFYVTRDQNEPIELPYHVVTGKVLEQLLDECLHSVQQAPPPLLERAYAPSRSNGVSSSDSRATRWGNPPTMPVNVTIVDDQDCPRDRIIIGEYKVVESEPLIDEPTPTPEAASPPDAMVFQALMREIQRLERLVRDYGVILQCPSETELDYIDLVFHRPIPLPRSSEPPNDATAETENTSDAAPRPGVMVSAVRIAFPHNYPQADLSMWVVGEHDYPVKLEALRARGATTLEQRVEVLLRWLTSSHPRDLPGLLEADAEFLYRQGLQAVRTSIDQLDVLLKSLEEKAACNPGIADDGPSLL